MVVAAAFVGILSLATAVVFAAAVALLTKLLQEQHQQQHRHRYRRLPNGPFSNALAEALEKMLSTQRARARTYCGSPRAYHKGFQSRLLIVN